MVNEFVVCGIVNNVSDNNEVSIIVDTGMDKKAMTVSLFPPANVVENIKKAKEENGTTLLTLTGKLIPTDDMKGLQMNIRNFNVVGVGDKGVSAWH